ncbi:MAG TPA: septum formation initiator family protein [Candidatus Binatia bacterium]|nr:septum formation initiator family protein [Candidatus Binatia bacterium]
MIAVAMVAVGLVVYGGSSLMRVWQMHRDVEGIEQEIDRLRARRQELGRDIERLRSDPDAIEQAARELLGLVKPGDKVLKLPPVPASRALTRPGGG